MVAILYQKDFVKRHSVFYDPLASGANISFYLNIRIYLVDAKLFVKGVFLNFVIFYLNGHFGNIYVYTNRHVKIVYDLFVRVVHRTTGIPGIWILTRTGALTHTGTCTVYVRTVYCTEDRITQPRRIKTRGRRNQTWPPRIGVFRRLSSHTTTLADNARSGGRRETCLSICDNSKLPQLLYVDGRCL